MVVRTVLRDHLAEILCFVGRFSLVGKGVAMSGFAVICDDISIVFLVCNY